MKFLSLLEYRQKWEYRFDHFLIDVILDVMVLEGCH